MASLNFLFVSSKQDPAKNFTNIKSDGSFKKFLAKQIAQNENSQTNTDNVLKSGSQKEDNFYAKVSSSMGLQNGPSGIQKDIYKTDDNNSQADNSANTDYSALIMELLNAIFNNTNNIQQNTNGFLEKIESLFSNIEKNDLNVEASKQESMTDLSKLMVIAPFLNDIVKLTDQNADINMDSIDTQNESSSVFIKELLNNLKEYMQNLNTRDNAINNEADLLTQFLNLLLPESKMDGLKMDGFDNRLYNLMTNLLKENDVPEKQGDIISTIIKGLETIIKLSKLQNNDQQVIYPNYSNNNFTEKDINDISFSDIQNSYVTNKQKSASDSELQDNTNFNFKDSSKNSFIGLINNKILENIYNVKNSQNVDMDFKLSLINQIATKINILHKENLTTLTVSLKPEWLGNVLIELNKDTNGNITGNIFVNNPHVKEIMEGSLSNLLTILKDQGLNISQLNVSLNNNQNNQSFQNQRRFSPKDGFDFSADEQQNIIENLIYEISENILNLQA